MMMIRLTIFIVVFTILSTFTIADDPCRFSHTRGIIDVTSLAQNDGRPKYLDKIPPTGSNYKYSYNPCKPFSEGNECRNVAACQVSLDGILQFALGTQESAVWSVPTGLGTVPQVAYSFGEKKVVVQMQCGSDTEDNFEALGEETINNYKFRLTHKCACFNGCGTGPQPPTTKAPGPGPGPEGGGITGGTVFIILLLVFLFVYFVGFASFYRFREQRSGVELIAHRTFWASLPGYAKDGTVYVYQRVTNRGGNSYQST